VTRLGLGLALALTLLVSGWMVAGAGAQSDRVAPFFREVNSGVSVETLSEMADYLAEIVANPGTETTHGNAAVALGTPIHYEATSNVSGRTAVDDGDATKPVADLVGRTIGIVGCDRGARIGGVTTITDGASTAATGGGAAGASIYNEVWWIHAANTSATDVTVDIRDGTAGSVLGTLVVPQGYDGIVATPPIPWTTSANTAVAFDPSASATSIVISFRGCKVK
jgi:hypothetical protein